MPLPPRTRDNEEDLLYADDILAERRVELQLSTKCMLALQYLPEFDNISLSFYTKGSPGFTISVNTSDWPRIQQLVANFNWRGRRQ